jgi:hypothetical protein
VVALRSSWIADSVGDSTDPVRQLERMMSLVREEYRGNSGRVCRHHAILFYQVAQRMGASVEFRTSGLTSKGRAWNRITLGGRTFVVDSFNEIWYEVE